ncbi:MAG: hypothetical protein ACKO6N_12110 [Myxococcota bacterium]
MRSVKWIGRDVVRHRPCRCWFFTTVISAQVLGQQVLVQPVLGQQVLGQQVVVEARR